MSRLKKSYGLCSTRGKDIGSPSTWKTEEFGPTGGQKEAPFIKGPELWGKLKEKKRSKGQIRKTIFEVSTPPESLALRPKRGEIRLIDISSC